jgi:membrane-associated phospholipid phosphatase
MHPVIATALVAASALAVRDGRAEAPDAALRERITGLRTPERDAVVRVATDLGSLYGVGAVAGVLALSGRSRLAVRVALSGATAWTLAQTAKPLLPRERPYESDGAERIVVEPAGTSWPSGHSAVAAAMASTLGEGRGLLTRGLLGAVAGAVGVSRVYVGVHHPSDVVAGYGIGALSASLVRLFSRR